MAKVRKSSEEVPRMRPALTPDAREGQLIALSMDLVEQRLRDGTASSQETTHFLKLGSSKHRLEMEKLAAENELMRAKKEALKSAERIEALYKDAIKAMQRYKGQDDEC